VTDAYVHYSALNDNSVWSLVANGVYKACATEATFSRLIGVRSTAALLAETNILDRDWEDEFRRDERRPGWRRHWHDGEACAGLSNIVHGVSGTATLVMMDGTTGTTPGKHDLDG